MAWPAALYLLSNFLCPDSPSVALTNKSYGGVYRSTVNLLTTVIGLISRLKGVLKEQQDTALQIITKKQELQHKLDDFRELLVAQEVERQEHATGQEQENIE
jgi:hypothetical protein